MAGGGEDADASAGEEAGLRGLAESSLRRVSGGRRPPTLSPSFSPFIQQVFVERPP